MTHAKILIKGGSSDKNHNVTSQVNFRRHNKMRNFLNFFPFNVNYGEIMHFLIAGVLASVNGLR